MPPCRLAAFQCPDGTPPPCGGRRPARPAAAAGPTIDPQRIAVLPFRVTTADTMLGEGVAELLSSEFTGGSGPRAVHMGTVLRAWRGAGGRAGAPLPPDDAMRVGRTMGAGLVVDGSVVGLGQRLTVSASVLSVADGRSRRATPVSGSADSIDVLLRRFTTNLMAAAGGETRATERGTLTESAAAMRAYLEGLAAWRRFDVRPAATAFERAFAEDSTFARAAFMRFVVTQWGVGSPRRWNEITWNLRARLSAQDRILLTAYLGEQFPAPRQPRQSLADRVRAAEQLPESPEAQYVLGDWLFHFGAAADMRDAMPRAVRLFQRSLELDSQETVLAHLAEAAVLAEDTAVARSLKPALEDARGAMWAPAWLVAGWLGDAAWLDRLRHTDRVPFSFALQMMVVAGVPGPLADEALAIGERLGQLSRNTIVGGRYRNAVFTGRPGAVRAMLGAMPPDDDVPFILTGMFSDGDTTLEREAVERWAARMRTPADSANTFCLIAVRNQFRGRPAPLDTALVRRHNPFCLDFFQFDQARRTGAPDLRARTEVMDSAIRADVQTSGGAENLLVAWAWEALGEPRKAFYASRVRPWGIALLFTEPLLAREEGRLALAAGDTSAALAAYRRYLGMRRDPEPVLVPQRDSIRAIYNRLTRR